jgi:hypothetical protein
MICADPLIFAEMVPNGKIGKEGNMMKYILYDRVEKQTTHK